MTNKVMLYFWSTTCRPCRSFSPVVEEMIDAYEGILRIFSVDVQSADTRTRELDIMSTPTLVMLENGIELKRIEGALPMMRLRKEIEEVFSL